MPSYLDNFGRYFAWYPTPTEEAAPQQERPPHLDYIQVVLVHNDFRLWWVQPGGMRGRGGRRRSQNKGTKSENLTKNETI